MQDDGGAEKPAGNDPAGYSRVPADKRQVPPGMFDIGFAELVLVGVVGLLVIGPERLPGTIRTASPGSTAPARLQ